MIKRLFERYKNYDIFHRVLIVTFLVTILTSYQLWTDYQTLVTHMDERKKTLDERKQSLNKARLEANRVPQMKENLIQAEVLFEESKSRLPDQFFIDNTLEKISHITEKRNLNLKLYDPGIPQKEEGSYTFISLPISIILIGKFHNIIEFMEDVLNLNQLLEIRNYKMTLVFPDKKNTDQKETELSEIEKQEKARNDSEIYFEAELFAFRSLSEEEFKNISTTTSKKNKRKTTREDS